jgi:hypothetical protein
MFHSRPAHKVRAYRPRLEVLEDRTLLSTYLVDHLADDLVGSGTSGSLRYAITQAVNGDAINFGVTGTINLTGGLPDLTQNISINGPGTNLLTVSGNHATRIFTVPFAATVVTISGLTIANGVSGQNVNGGGGIFNRGHLTLSNCTVTQNQSGGDGGGISNFGTATLNNCTITNNTADGSGGGVANERGTVTGSMTIANCTISGNNAYGAGDLPTSARGGGIYNGHRPDGHGNSNLVVTNSTITGNAAEANIAEGGGLDSEGDAVTGALSTLTINNSTISGNSTTGFYVSSGGGIYIWTTTATMRNSILAGNIAHYVLGSDYPNDLFGTLTSSAYNLIGGDPRLGPLQDNGGPTQTMALLAGSPALNAGDPDQLGVADQRGVVRSGGVNVGAYQASASAFVLTAPATVTAGTPFDVTVKAVDPFGQTALGYTGTVTFSTTDPDPGVVLPAAYPFTLADQGTHTFSGASTLITPGTWALTATDTAGGITASATVTVNGGGGGGPSPSAPQGLAVTDLFFAALSQGPGGEGQAPATSRPESGFAGDTAKGATVVRAARLQTAGPSAAGPALFAEAGLPGEDVLFR